MSPADISAADIQPDGHLATLEEGGDAFAINQPSQEDEYMSPVFDGNPESDDTDSCECGSPYPPSLLGQFPLELLMHIFALACDDGGFTGRSLSLVSRAFRVAAEPVMLRSLHLTTTSHICGLAHRLSVDPLVKVRVLHLSMNMPDIATELKEQEADWGRMDGTGSLVWDSSYGEPAYGDYVFDSDDENYVSSESSEDVNWSDIAEDLAFFASDDGQKRTNAVYADEGAVVDGSPRWPVDIGLENAQILVVNCISTILSDIHVLRTLTLHCAGNPFILFPRCPALTELDIDVPFLVHPDEKRAAFPALQRLCLRGRCNREYIDVDTIIVNAPALTHLRIPFAEDLLHALISALGLFPDSAHPIRKSTHRFQHIKRIILAYHYMDLTAEALEHLNEKIPSTWRETISMSFDSAIRSATSTWGKED
ncbi:hypothetical protein BD779DRAFT_1470643 [Infundibulicybe gibba]|nr:hypothetical protein BD779DRAFT_1470643 [Infundibulicybe gibba]